MRRRLVAGALLCAGCFSSGPKEPPSGLVDPDEVGADQLAIDWKKAPAQPTPPSAPTSAPVTNDDASASGGGSSEMEWTAEHCAKLGAKFTELGQSSGMPESMAAQTGQKFAADCLRDKVGETLDRHEYDCVMAATSVLSIPGCAR